MSFILSVAHIKIEVIFILFLLLVKKNSSRSNKFNLFVVVCQFVSIKAGSLQAIVKNI